MGKEVPNPGNGSQTNQDKDEPSVSVPLLDICGENQALESFKAWLWQGPQYAQVTSVRCEPAKTKFYSDFKIG